MIDCFTEHGYTILPNQDIVRNERLKVIDNDGYIGYISYNNIQRGRHLSPFEYKANNENYIYLWCIRCW